MLLKLNDRGLHAKWEKKSAAEASCARMPAAGVPGIPTIDGYQSK